MKIRFRKRRKLDREQAMWLARVLARERVIRTRIAERLRRRAARLSPVQLQWWFVLFVSGGLVVYTWIGIRAVADPRGSVDWELKRTSDSLGAARPGFADTIRRLEELYPEH